MELVKAEILWTRECALRCHYCAMVTGQTNTQSIEFWKQGLDNLKALGCSFIAIYGAEPLSDFDKLPEFVGYAHSIGMDMTVISAGVEPDTFTKLRILYEHGLRSLTTSYDIVALDGSSKIKSNNALPMLEYFRSLGPVDNVAVCATLTKKNYKHLYENMVEMTRRNIWSFFDIIHADRGQPGSKCKGNDPELMFSKEDLPEVVEVLTKIRDNKDKLMIHASDGFFNLIIRKPELLLNYDWMCTESHKFPSWVTVDYDGQVYPCDDFQPKGIGYPITELKEKWDEISDVWRASVNAICPGCVWNTHIDANYIKEGKAKLSDYVHKPR